MKKTLIHLFIALIFFSCKHDRINESTNKPLMRNDIMIDSTLIKSESQVVHTKYIDSISGFINPKLGLYNFKFLCDSGYDFLYKIKVYRDKRIIQTINVNDIIYPHPSQFKLIDWNQDGYKDISVLSFLGPDNTTFLIWTYSSKEKRFVFNKKLSNEYLLEDSTEKYVIYHYSTGSDFEFWDTCRFDGTKLEFIKGRSVSNGTDNAGNSWERVERSKRISNKIEYTIDSVKYQNKKKSTKRIVILKNNTKRY